MVDPLSAPRRRARLACLALGCLTALPAGQDGEARKAAAGFRRALEKGLHPALLEQLSALAAHDAPPTVDLVLEVFRDGPVVLLPTARRTLAALSRPRSREHLLHKGLGHRDGGVRAQVLWALGDAPPPGTAWIEPVREHLDDRDAGARAAAVRALGRGRAPGLGPALMELAQDRSARVRCRVPGALVRLLGPRALGVLASMAGDEHWRVRLSVMQALADLKTRGAVERLVDMLEAEPGRLQEDAADLLGRLTGRRLGLEARRWRAFLEQASPDFLQHVGATPENGPRYAGALQYHSVPTSSRRFVLATDLSGSMQSPLGFSDRYGQEPLSRIGLARVELQRLLVSLDEGVLFGLVTFRDQVTRWKRKLVAARPAVLRDAAKEVRAYRAHGGTNIFDVLEGVFELAAVSLDEPAPVPDTLFLLTDGAPSVGALRDPELLLEYVAERNRELQLRVHCIALTAGPDSTSFLRRLARLTGGTYAPLVEAQPPPPAGS